jgi:Adenylate and Guanylate cyclase catalytic domain/SAM domain (Sterile alpha motif)/BON domain
MTPIAQWLASLGLSEYAGRFAENRIDLSILPDLTDQDLKELGVVLGDRRRILRAIAEPAETVSATPQPKPRDEAERRQVTVMFSDLVGSTALATSMDPEDLRDIVSAFQKCIAETVGHFSGFVAQYMGDGVLVYFGSPQAQEDDAERAVRAGLALIAAVARLETRASLQTRVGIATGLVDTIVELAESRRLPDRAAMRSALADKLIEARIRSAFAEHISPSLAPLAVSVSVTGEKVTLDGISCSGDLRRRAEGIARAVSGKLAIDNRIVSVPSRGRAWVTPPVAT